VSIGSLHVSEMAKRKRCRRAAARDGEGKGRGGSWTGKTGFGIWFPEDVEAIGGEPQNLRVAGQESGSKLKTATRSAR